MDCLFDELVQHYGELLDLALEQRVYKVNYQLSESLRALGDQLGLMGNLVSYYRNYNLSVRGGATSDGQKGEARRGETQ
jgi:hypothetical protein